MYRPTSSWQLTMVVSEISKKDGSLTMWTLTQSCQPPVKEKRSIFDNFWKKRRVCQKQEEFCNGSLLLKTTHPWNPHVVDFAHFWHMGRTFL